MRKYHLVASSEIKKPMSQGSLGLRSFVEMNWVLQGKMAMEVLERRQYFLVKGDRGKI